MCVINNCWIIIDFGIIVEDLLENWLRPIMAHISVLREGAKYGEISIVKREIPFYVMKLNKFRLKNCFVWRNRQITGVIVTRCPHAGQAASTAITVFRVTPVTGGKSLMADMTHIY